MQINKAPEPGVAATHGLLLKARGRVLDRFPGLGEVPEARGNRVRDLHTATLMREHGLARILTRSTDFHRFGFLEVIDPLRTT